jgi:carbamoyltransferase
MPVTLGISCYYHDAAAAIVRDGEIVAAAQEERFSRLKGDPSFPLSAISYCLEEARIGAAQLDSVVYYDKPVRTFHRLLESYKAVAPRGLKSWLTAMPIWISQKLHIREIVKQTLEYDGPVLFTPHHLAHAASAFFPSPFDEAAILTIDGVGEWSTASIGVGRGNEAKLLREMRFPDSLGLLYSAFTHFCGFKVNSGEYKLMGLAPYGEPSYLDKIKSHVASVNDDGTVSLSLDYFSFLDGLEMTSEKFAQLFDGPRRPPESRIGRRERDLAASIQKLTEEAVLKMARWTYRETHLDTLCMSGGVALNCVANGHLLREGPFREIWVQPAAGDAGSALGAALAVQLGHHGVPRIARGSLDRQRGSYLGPSFGEAEIEAFLDGTACDYVRIGPDDRAGTIAGALADGKIVGMFAGRMEYGPRALGARSILGDPRRPDMQKIMNLRIKYRESFRPFAPAVLAEDVADYFDLDRPSPYMLFVAGVRPDRRLRRSGELGDDLINAVNESRSDIPAVTHWDYSARIQTVHHETNPFFHAVISAFKERTGCAVLVNTSFNVRGEPIVCTPADAYRCFMATEIDYLYLDGYWLAKDRQPAQAIAGATLDEFEPD